MMLRSVDDGWSRGQFGRMDDGKFERRTEELSTVNFTCAREQEKGVGRRILAGVPETHSPP